jgi:hypothetical protein
LGFARPAARGNHLVDQEAGGIVPERLLVRPPSGQRNERRVMRRHLRTEIALGLSLLAAACAPANLYPSDPGVRMLAAGRYTDAKNALVAELKNDPDNPYIQFDLASAYQDLGRMDLAAPLYRKVIREGQDIVPPVASDPTEAGMTLSDMACTNLRAGLHDNFTC